MQKEGEMTTNATELVTQEAGQLPAMTFNRDQVDLIKRTVARGTTDDELALFLYTAKRTGLDPLIRQIYAVKRFNSKEGKEVMAIQTGIDGYRLISERTGKYAPGREPSFEERNGKLFSSTAYVKKFAGGTWHEVAATAHFDEYVQKDKSGNPTPMWNRMPRVMLSKCAEALALRRAFPAEMSGVYTHEEMGQAEATPTTAIEAETVPEPNGNDHKETEAPESIKRSAPTGTLISEAQSKRFYAIYKGAGKTDQEVRDYLLNRYSIETSRQITKDIYEEVCTWAAAKDAVEA